MPISDISAQAWDEQLLQWPRAHLLQSYGWGELQQQAGWEIRRVLVKVERDSSTAEALSTLPLTVLLSKPIFPGLARRLYVPKGPACAPDDLIAWEAVWRQLESCAGDERAASITLEPPILQGEVNSLAIANRRPRHLSSPMQPEHTAVVNLRGEESDVLARMRPKGRYNLRLAQRRDVEVECFTGATVPKLPVASLTQCETAAAPLAQLCNATAHRHGIALPGADYFAAVLRNLPGAAVLLAKVEQVPVAGIMLVWFGEEAIYLDGGSLDTYRDRQPSTLVQWEAMRLARAVGCTRYDLWGMPPSDDPAHPWYGLRQFKVSLGGIAVQSVGAFEYVQRPFAQRILSATMATKNRLRSLRRGAGHLLRRQ